MNTARHKAIVKCFATGIPITVSEQSFARDAGLIFVNGGVWSLTEYGRSFLPAGPDSDASQCADDDSYWPSERVDWQNHEAHQNHLNVVSRSMMDSLPPIKTTPGPDDVVLVLQEAGVMVANGVSAKDTQVAGRTALSIQEGGSHYCGMKIQPVEYIHANKIPFIEGACIKYLSRHREKGKAEDIRKVIHFCQLLLELEYNER